MSSVRPVTEISDESFERHLPEIAESRQGEAQDLRSDDAASHQRPIHADADRGLELAARNGEIGGAEHFRLIGARDDADGERARGKGRHADEALVTEEERRFGENRGCAEIDEIDDEQLRQAAEQRGIGLPQAAREQLPGEPRPGDEAADRRADQEAAGGNEKRHRRALEERQAPAALAEAEDRQIATSGPPRARSFQQKSALKAASSRRHIDLEPLLGIFLDRPVGDRFRRAPCRIWRSDPRRSCGCPCPRRPRTRRR